MSSVLTQQAEVPFRDFPELNKLCWNEHGETISAEDAYRLYVRHWDFVRRAPLDAPEMALLRTLNDRFGHLLDV